VVFAILLDELLDTVLAEAFIQYPEKRFKGVILNTASNLGLSLIIVWPVMNIDFAVLPEDEWIGMYCFLAEVGTLVIYNFVQYLTRLRLLTGCGKLCKAFIASIFLALVLFGLPFVVIDFGVATITDPGVP
jgi:hypothetical protein